MTHPGSESPTDAEGYFSYLVFSVVTDSGQRITGRRINEDTFTIQLRDIENRHYSFRKGELKEIQRLQGKSLMPSYGETLNPSQVDDLVAYLAQVGEDR